MGTNSCDTQTDKSNEIQNSEVNKLISVICKLQLLMTELSYHKFQLQNVIARNILHTI